jgi:hypothetical protein
MDQQQQMYDAHVKASVEKAVKGSCFPWEAMKNIKKALGIKLAHIEVQEKGEFHFTVFLKLYPESAHYNFICDR